MPLGSRGGYRKRDDWTGRQFGGGGVPIREGILETALSAPGCVWDEPTSATVRKLRRNPTTKALEEIAEGASTSANATETVYNSDPDLTGVVGAYCRWTWINGVKQFVYVGCEDATEGCGSSSGGA